MKNRIALIVLPLLFCLLASAQENNSTHSKWSMPITKYKNSFGIHFNGSSMGLDGSRLSFYDLSYGVSYDRLIYRRYALGIAYSYMESIFNEAAAVKTFYNTVRIDNKLYIKQTKDHAYITLGAIKEWRNTVTFATSVKQTQTNATIGLGGCLFLNQICSHLFRSDHFSMEAYVYTGLPFSRANSAIKAAPGGSSWPTSIIALKYHFNK